MVCYIAYHNAPFVMQVNVEELGSVVKIRVKDSMKQHNRMWSIQEIVLKDVDTKEVLTFNFAAHVGENLLTEPKADFANQDFENKLGLVPSEIESYALRHDGPVIPSEYFTRLLLKYIHALL